MLSSNITSSFFFEYVCPSLGVVFATAMFTAPVNSLRMSLSKGSLGNLNPTPWAFMTGNCLGWATYGFIKKDIFLVISNVPGLILSIWLNLGALKIQYFQQQLVLKNRGSENLLSFRMEDDDVINNNDGNHNLQSGTETKELEDIEEVALSFDSLTFHEYWLFPILVFWCILLSCVSLIPECNESKELIVGITVNFNLVVFYGAPLSTIVKVIKQRNSLSIHRKTVATGALNSIFWSLYGLAVDDLIIFIPNFCGIVLSVIQTVLCLIFPRKRNISHNQQDEANSDENMNTERQPGLI